MNRISQQNGTRGLTRIEVLVIVVIVSVIAFLVLYVRGGASAIARTIHCASNLKQVTLAFRIWSDDHDSQYPQDLSGASDNPLLASVKWPTTGNPDVHPDSPYTYLVFAAMSNELSTPKWLVCPADHRPARMDFGSDFVGPTGGHNLGVSYFVGRDASDSNPRMLLTGDRNICADTAARPIPNHRYGISPDGTEQGAACAFPTNFSRLRQIGWSPRMHRIVGNIGFADGSVDDCTSIGLVNRFVSAAASSTNVPTQNYLLFP
jgi:type II secretory pathway pseudopilin PulG